MISDETALKAALANKGATSLVFCCLCQNALDHKSALAEADGAQGMVSSLEPTYPGSGDIRLNPSGSLCVSFKMLQDTPNKYVERLQTALVCPRRTIR